MRLLDTQGQGVAFLRDSDCNSLLTPRHAHPSFACRMFARL
jgi:hypothetical protein